MPAPNSAFSSSASRSVIGSNSQTNYNVGGGNKKAGFPYQIGRDSWTSIYLGTSNLGKVSGCGGLKCFQTLRYTGTVHQSRPQGSPVTTSYWR